jgi:hypothetical protein
LYKLGIEEFLLGLNIKLEGEGVERGARVQEKMESNLKMALQRVEELSKYFETRVTNPKSINKEFPILISDHKSPELDMAKKRAQTTNTVNKPTMNRSSDSANPLKNNDYTAIKTGIKKADSANVRPSSSYQTSSRPSSSNFSSDSSSNKNSKKTTNRLSTPPVSNEKIPITKKLKIPNIEERLVNFILDEIIDTSQGIQFSDIGDLKKSLINLVNISKC